ncbi:MAG: hypothetical protein U0V75_02730 [Ferruginibacter sp.]
MNDFTEIFFAKSYEKEGSDFFRAYGAKTIITCPDKKMKGLKPKPLRTCRFCNLKYGQVFFKKEAHIISRLLGNEYLVSDFECDICNSLFSTYESHLSHFIGPTRAFLKLYGVQENYKYKSPNKKSKIENYGLYGLENSFSISREDVQDQTFHFDREKGLTKMLLTKHSYSPLSVYKSILKIALSCLSDEDAKDYKLAFEYIRTSNLDGKLKGVTNMQIYSLPPGTGYSIPFASLYEKRDKNARLCTHVFSLTFLNQIYQIVLPLNKNDLPFYDNSLIDIMYCSPLFADEESANSVQITQKHLDMSSSDLVKGEVDTIYLQYDPKENANAKVFDPRTNEIKDDGFNFNAIKQLVFMPSDSKIVLPPKGKE